MGQDAALPSLSGVIRHRDERDAVDETWGQNFLGLDDSPLER